MKSLERIPLTSSSVGHARDPKRVGKSALDGKASPAPGTNSVLDFLNSAKITFSIVDHSPAFSSQAAAMSAHVSGNDVGKAVLVKLFSDGADPEVVMCVLRAPDRILLEEFACATGAQQAQILTEEAVQERTKELGLTVEAGAVPALPQLYKCRCFMDAALAQDELVYFNAGEYERLVAMSMHDYKSLVAPIILSFAHEINSNIRNVQKVLNKSGFMNKSVVHYNVMRHNHTETAPQTAKAVGLPEKAFIKAAAASVDGKPVLCVLCSHHEVDLQRLQQLTGAVTVEHATDSDLHTWFPSIQVDTIPPFGHLFEMPTYIDTQVGQWPNKSNAEVAFCAGSFTEAISMRFEDYLNAVTAFSKPMIGSLATADSHGQENMFVES